MGFYAPAQIVRDAEAHGVEVRPACANASRWDCTLEPTDDEGRFAVRLGLRMVRGLANAHAAAIVAARADEPFASVDDLWRRASVPQAALVQLAEADAFRPAFGLARREALWAIRGLADEPLPLFAAAAAREARIVPEAEEPAVALRADARRRRGRRRLPPSRAVAEAASGRLPARGAAAPADRHLRRGHGRPRRPLAGGRRHRARPPAARLGQGRAVHHPGGRDRHRQPRGLAEGLRAEPAHHHVRRA